MFEIKTKWAISHVGGIACAGYIFALVGCIGPYPEIAFLMVIIPVITGICGLFYWMGYNLIMGWLE